MNETPTLAEPIDPGTDPGGGPRPRPGRTAPAPSTPRPPYSTARTTPGRPASPPLRRSRTDRVFGGVCGGLAQQYGIDPVLIRILLVVARRLQRWRVRHRLHPRVVAHRRRAAGRRPDAGLAAGRRAPCSRTVPPSYAAGGTGTFVDPAHRPVYGAAPVLRTAAARAALLPRAAHRLPGVVVGGVLGVLAVAGVDIPVRGRRRRDARRARVGLLVGAVPRPGPLAHRPGGGPAARRAGRDRVPRAVERHAGGRGRRPSLDPHGVAARRRTSSAQAGSASTSPACPAGPATVTAKVGVGNAASSSSRHDTTVVLHGRDRRSATSILPDEPSTSGTSLGAEHDGHAATAGRPPSPRSTSPSTSDSESWRCVVRRHDLDWVSLIAALVFLGFAVGLRSWRRLTDVSSTAGSSGRSSSSPSAPPGSRPPSPPPRARRRPSPSSRGERGPASQTPRGARPRPRGGLLGVRRHGGLVLDLPGVVEHVPGDPPHGVRRRPRAVAPRPRAAPQTSSSRSARTSASDWYGGCRTPSLRA